MESQPGHCKEELELLKLLKELHVVFVTAINSLGDKTPPSVESRYIVHAAKSVNFASDGYLLLREAGKVHASKMMVRPMIEVVIKSVAVEKKKGLLSSIAYSEIQEMKKMFSKTPANETAAKAQEDDLRKGFAKDPSYPIDFKVYDTRRIAEFADKLDVYDTAYRLYCKFTHSAVAAVEGHYDHMTDPIDTINVLWAICMMIDQLKTQTPAVIPDLSSLYQRIDYAHKAMLDAWGHQV